MSLLQRAKASIPGGVNSPVRAFKSVGGNPLFVSRGEGALIYDTNDRPYIDYVGSWGPLILGHAHPEVLEHMTYVASRGTSFGAPTEREIELAELIIDIVPGLEMVRFVNSGTEAAMSAIRLARAYTGRDIIIKFNGCYHGHSDSLLVDAGSGVATLGIPGSPGVPDAVAALTLSIEFNDLELARKTVEQVGKERIAAIVLEPIPGNMGFIAPREGYLEGLRDLCSQSNILLLFDEVMSGFRVALGGAVEKLGVQPDLYTFGKVIGGGLPVGAFGGKREVMEMLAPDGPVYQAGTLSGNPLAMAAGLKTLEILRRDDPYPELERKTAMLLRGLQALADDAGIAFQTGHFGSMAGIFFSENTVNNYSEAKASHIQLFSRYFRAMLEQGVYLAPSAFELLFVSAAHTDSHIDQTLTAAKNAFDSLRD